MSKSALWRGRPATTWALSAAALAFLIVALLVFATTRALWPRWFAIMALAWWLPGVLLVAHWRLPGRGLVEASVLAVGLGLCWMVAIALLIHWLPGPIDLWTLVLAYELAAAVLAVALIWRPPVAIKQTSRSTWVWLLGLLLLAMVLRLPGLDYHEFHIDEVEVLRRAGWAIGGVDGVLARHSKGPGEIAVATVVYRALGTVNEGTGRLPFGLMSVASIIATAVLGRRLFSLSVGLWAGVLLACNGFALGLSRLVQYQPAVLLLSVLAILACWEFAQQGDGRWLALAMVFSTIGVVMHYEFVLLVPALLYLAWMGWERSSNRKRPLVILATASVVGIILVAATYLPIFLDPHFSTTRSHLATRLGGIGAFNIPFFVEMGTFYNSIYFGVGLVLLVIAGLVLGWRQAPRRAALLVLWFGTPFILLLFVMELPGTHFYLFMPAWSLLAALPLAALTKAPSLRPLLRWSGLALVAAWLAVSAGYLYLLFFQQSPEYLGDYEKSRVPFYWAPYGPNPPQQPRFGFPIQQGWKALGTLAHWGYLDGSFSSNEGSRIHEQWYLLGLDYTGSAGSSDYVLVATHVQYQNPTFNEAQLEGYQRLGEVRVQDEPRIEIWGNAPLPVPYVTYDVEDLVEAFDRTVPAVEDWPDPPAEVQGVSLNQAMLLESAALYRVKLRPNDTLHILLVWQPQQPLTTDYKVFVHLVDAVGQPVTQWDGLPCLNTCRTSQWAVGASVRDHIFLHIPDDMPPGQYSLVAGLYDETTGERLGGQTIQIGAVTIQ
jgi:hypothetical protein